MGKCPKGGFMKKKGLLVLVLAAFITMGAFAEETSSDFYDMHLGLGYNWSTLSIPSLEIKNQCNGVFFLADCAYVDLVLGDSWNDQNDHLNIFDLGLNIKYPFFLASWFYIFPLVGYSYQWTLVNPESSSSKDMIKMNAHCLKLGGGFNIILVDSFVIGLRSDVVLRKEISPFFEVKIYIGKGGF